MAYIKFARNQTDEATEMLLKVDNILTMNSTGVTNLTVKLIDSIKDDEIIQYALQVAATGGATLTRPNIVQKVIDTIEKAGLSGPIAQVPDMEVQTAAWSSSIIDTTP